MFSDLLTTCVFLQLMCPYDSLFNFICYLSTRDNTKSIFDTSERCRSINSKEDADLELDAGTERKKPPKKGRKIQTTNGSISFICFLIFHLVYLMIMLLVFFLSYYYS